MTVLRLAALAALALIVMLGLALTAGTSANPGHPEKRIFPGRWYQQVVGGDYGDWMTLRTSDVWVNCDVSEVICGSRWYDPFDGAITDWNTQATTVDFQYFEDDQDPNYDVNVYVEDVVLGMPDLLGIALSFDINGDPCDDTCTFHYFDVIAGDDAHTGEYATPAERQGTIVHELGHAINLMHESATFDSSQHFECGLDEFGGTIPHSVMAYDCIDPVSLGGAGETYVQEWDVCGVNHAYFDPGIGYAGCGVVSSSTPTPPPGGGGLAGDVDCNGNVNAVDSLKTLRYVAGLPVQQNEPCTDVGGGIAGFAAHGGQHFQGDVDCNGNVNAVDALKDLRYVAGLPNNLPAGCPAIGTPNGGGSTPTPTPGATPSPTVDPSLTACGTFGVGANIPDNSATGITGTLDVSEFGTVEDIDVCVNVDHPRPNDLKLTLKHVPTGTEVLLFDGTACGQPNVRLYFDDEAGNAICPLNGAVRPGEPLSAFDGEQVHGEWELTFADVISGQTGKALGFTLYYLYGD